MDPRERRYFTQSFVYLLLESEQKSVIYIGSHNWTARALGPHGPRNVEASVRLELPFEPEHLNGIGNSIPSAVNRHLIDAWNSNLCISAQNKNVPLFDQWHWAGCRNRSAGSLEEAIILLAVCDSSTTAPRPEQWSSIESIYLHSFEEKDGSILWESGDNLLILVWDSLSALRQAKQPTILKCRKSAQLAGKTSRRHSSNKATNPIVGFSAVLGDKNQASSADPERQPARTTTTWSGRHVEIFDFFWSSAWSSSAKVPSATPAKYQFYLEVDAVVVPAKPRLPQGVELAWSRESFGVSADKSIRVETIGGFQVNEEESRIMCETLKSQFHVNLREARVLPRSSGNFERVGKRFSSHPLHEAFIGRREAQHAEEFYSRVPKDGLAADVEKFPEPGDQPAKVFNFMEPIPRLERVFTRPWLELEPIWREIADQFKQ